MLKCCNMIPHICADRGNCDKYYYFVTLSQSVGQSVLNGEAIRIVNKQVEQEEVRPMERERICHVLSYNTSITYQTIHTSSLALGGPL